MSIRDSLVNQISRPYKAVQKFANDNDFNGNFDQWSTGNRDLRSEYGDLSNQLKSSNPFLNTAKDLAIGQLQGGGKILSGVRDMTNGAMQGGSEGGSGILKGAIQTAGGFSRFTPAGEIGSNALPATISIAKDLYNGQTPSLSNATGAIAQDQSASDALGVHNPVAAGAVDILSSVLAGKLGSSVAGAFAKGTPQVAEDVASKFSNRDELGRFIKAMQDNLGEHAVNVKDFTGKMSSFKLPNKY